MADGFFISAEEWPTLQAMIRHWQQSGAWQPTRQTRDQAFTRMPEPAYMHNDSGETIPAYACCQVTGTIEIGGQNFLLVDKPADTDGTSGWYVFNNHEPIADDSEGKWQVGPVVRAYKNSGTVTAGDAWGPTSGQWYVSSGTGNFIAAGEDDIASNVLKLFTAVGGGSPSSGDIFYRATLTENMGATTTGEASADLADADGNDLSTTIAALDSPSGRYASLTNTTEVDVLLQNGKYYIIQADCPA